MCIVTFCLLGLVSYSGTGLLLLLYLLLLMPVLRHITEGLQIHVKLLLFCHIDEGGIQYTIIGFTDVAHNQCPLPYWAGNTPRMHVPMLKECFTSQSFGSQTVDYNQCLLPHWAQSISLAYVGMLKKECFVTHYFGTRMAQHKNAFLIGHVDILLIAVKSRGKWQHPATGSLLAA